MKTEQAYRLAAGGHLPPNIDWLNAGPHDPAELKTIAAVMWNMAGRKTSGRCDLKANEIASLMRLTANQVGRMIVHLQELGVIRRTRGRNNGRNIKPRFMWFGIPAGSLTA